MINIDEKDLLLEAEALKDNELLYLECLRYDGKSVLLKDRTTDKQYRDWVIIYWGVYNFITKRYSEKK